MLLLLRVLLCLVLFHQHPDCTLLLCICTFFVLFCQSVVYIESVSGLQAGRNLASNKGAIDGQLLFVLFAELCSQELIKDVRDPIYAVDDAGGSVRRDVASIRGGFGTSCAASAEFNVMQRVALVIVVICGS